jgi:hypothetical protein
MSGAKCACHNDTFHPDAVCDLHSILSSSCMKMLRSVLSGIGLGEKMKHVAFSVKKWDSSRLDADVGLFL